MIAWAGRSCWITRLCGKRTRSGSSGSARWQMLWRWRTLHEHGGCVHPLCCGWKGGGCGQPGLYYPRNAGCHCSDVAMMYVRVDTCVPQGEDGAMAGAVMALTGPPSTGSSSASRGATPTTPLATSSAHTPQATRRDPTARRLPAGVMLACVYVGPTCSSWDSNCSCRLRGGGGADLGEVRARFRGEGRHCIRYQHSSRHQW
jgi:hypothetical protein